MAELKEGDVVQLKSGGPCMTISRIDAEGTTKCIWFVGEKNQEAWFPIFTLIKADETPLAEAGFGKV